MLKRCLRYGLSKFENAIRPLGYRISWVPPVILSNPKAELPFELEFVIAHLLLQKDDIFFIQIGANDGISNDPLYKFVTRHNWSGILVEPIPEVYEILKENYKNYPNLQFLNVAIGESDGFRTLYTVKIDADTFKKAHQYSSFRKDVVAQQTQWVPDIADRITETRVRCISLATLFAEAGGREIDILQIDTEGYDYEILKLVDFNQTRPSLICYEHCNLTKTEMTAAAELLVEQGYRLTRDNLDTIAYRPVASYGFRL
ncbi:MAG TPA: FkbM family methyltransferase [Stellaceae bacterium]|nr:FkbM family methyltransferase [Stellaceae bacterium]